MSILLAFLPFIAFAVVSRLFGPTEALVAGAVVAIGPVAGATRDAPAAGVPQ